MLEPAAVSRTIPSARRSALERRVVPSRPSAELIPNPWKPQDIAAAGGG